MNRKLFTYWHQGFDNAPAIIKACLQVAKHLHPDWTVHKLDAETVSNFIEPIPIPAERWRQLCLAHRSDLIRTQLLIRYGGVWADPTVWFSRPLDDWLPQQMASGLFLFRRPGPDRLISNWFIAAEPGNRLLIRLYETLCRYWSDNDFDNFDRPMRPGAHFLHRVLRRHIELPRLWLTPPIIRLFRTFPYMIYHYAFHDLVRRDAECRAVWDRMPAVSADGPIGLQRLGLTEPFDDRAEALLTAPERPPLYKLSWKALPESPGDGSILDRLLALAEWPTANTGSSQVSPGPTDSRFPSS